MGMMVTRECLKLVATRFFKFILTPKQRNNPKWECNLDLLQKKKQKETYCCIFLFFFSYKLTHPQKTQYISIPINDMKSQIKNKRKKTMARR
jgi:hypothetical protein